MTASLFDRLGGTNGCTQLASDLVDIHLANPRISPRFAGSDPARLKHGAATFLIAGTGGPNVYQGQNMLETHRGMNISEQEFLAVLDDALVVFERNDIGQREREEVLFVLYSMKPEIVGV